MGYKSSSLLILLLLCSILSFAQEKYTISGYVKDDASGEVLVGATVFLQDTKYGAYTNEYGFYSLTVPEGEYTLVVRYIGYLQPAITLDLKDNQRINIPMKTEDVETDVVEITGRKADENVSSTEMGKVELDIERIEKLPALLGEVDIIKTIQLLPGVQSAGEGQTGLYIRGGGVDQNLVLLDEAVVYNTGHLFGFFSVFNPDAVKDVTLIKGGMPASYGGRLSSVIDVSMKEGNNKSFHGAGGIGLVSSRLTLEGPIVKDKASFLVSGRRTYIDVLAQPFIRNEEAKGNRYYFYDLNAKANYVISDKDRLFLSGYFGRDIFSFQNPRGSFGFRIPWGNSTATLRWNHLFNDKLFMNLTALYNDYNFEFGANFQEDELSVSSRIRDANLKLDFDYYPAPNHKLEFGINYSFHIFDPNNLSAKLGDINVDQTGRFRRYANEAAVYFQDEFELGNRWKFNTGIRLSGFQQIGPFKEPVRDVIGNTIDTTYYDRFETVRTYGGVEPRFSGRYQVNENSSIKAGVSVNTQYVHLVSGAGTLPSDIWVPSSSNIKPQRGIQYSIGYFKNFLDNKLEASVEIYYRSMKNQVAYSETYVADLREDYEASFVYGDGYAYGAEFFFQKRYGKLTGWIGYTLGFTNRTFPDLNEGETFPAAYDRRHDLSIVATYEFEIPFFRESAIERRKAKGKRTSIPVAISGTFVYGTGNALTLPERRYVLPTQGDIANVYGDRNSFRMPSYHRADLAITFYGRKRKRFQSNWVVAVYNAYNRRNPYFIYFDYEGNPLSGELETKAYQVSVFPLIPSITWNFKF